MGKIRRGGYVFVWWIGDHSPRHVHVFDRRGRILGRVALSSWKPLDDWEPSRKVVQIIQQLESEGRL